ncbi:hypothetical protein MMC24_003775 [Lignoscripta atroalba]|nr:hypothetical protein [Lignoscripta atroalba]
MSNPGPAAEVFGRIAYEFSIIQPYISTYLHLIVSALFPIYAGAHASLSRPSSAAEPPKREKKDGEDADDEDGVNETSQPMEGLSPIDAILYPLLTGCMLAGLYFLIKWLKDPAMLNKILNWYLSIFGVFSVARLLVDAMDTFKSYIFPSRFNDRGVIYEIKRKQRLAIPKTNTSAQALSPVYRSSPLPGSLSRLSLSPTLQKSLWILRELPSLPLVNIEIYVRGLIEAKFPMGLDMFSSLISAVTVVLYFNLVDKPWWLTNILGFGFSYNALQIMSPTTFWTGTLVLSSLFVYDIYFVFFTPLMVTVATKLDIPVKLLFPRPPGSGDDPGKKSLAMLGLGDVVLPGIMIGLALRFDLYLFYLRKQTSRRKAKAISANEESDVVDVSTDDADSAVEVVKAPWRPATGGWGERFWLGITADQPAEGGSFPKTYFHASLIGYVIGMLCTLGVMHVYHHGQPALLYLVPAVLGSLWGTALVKGDLKDMWDYTEASDDSGKLTKEQISDDIKTAVVDPIRDLEKPAKENSTLALSGKSATEGRQEPEKAPLSKPDRRIISFSLTLPKLVPARILVTQDAKQKPFEKPLPSLEDELRLASEGRLGTSSSAESSTLSSKSSFRRQSLTEVSGEPAGKRQRRE